MSSPNSSVIICDTPSPAQRVVWSNAVTNYRKRLRSSDSSRNLLSTVYESPLNHFKRNLKPISTSTEDVSDVTVVSTPPVKKRKTGFDSRQLFNLDESIVVLADKRPIPAPESETSDTEANDVVEVPEENQPLDSTNTSREKKAEVKTVKKGKSTVTRSKTLKQKRQKCSKEKETPKSSKNRKTPKSTVDSSTVNDENHNGQIMETKKNECATTATATATVTEASTEAATAADVEEIEVVWSSKPKTDVPRAKASQQQPIIMDVAPTLANLWMNQFQKTLRAAIMCGESSGGGQSVGNRNNNDRRGPPVQGRLREIVIDGSNVAMGHSRNKTFSEKGLQIVIDYFKSRGHVVKAFLPQSARARGRDLIEKLHVEGTVVFTPSRNIAGRQITPYDDRYILDYATRCDGIVVSSDQYRDLWAEKPQWRNTIENRLLTPTFVGDYLMFPEDPLGRTGPKLEQFLRF